MVPGSQDPPSPQPPSPPPPLSNLGRALQGAIGEGSSPRPSWWQQQEEWLDKAEQGVQERWHQHSQSRIHGEPLSVPGSYTERGFCGRRPRGDPPGYSPCLPQGQEGELAAGGRADSAAEGAGQEAEGVAEGAQGLAVPRSRSQTPDMDQLQWEQQEHQQQQEQQQEQQQQQQQQQLPAPSTPSRTSTLNSDSDGKQQVFPAPSGPPAEGEEFWREAAAEGRPSQGRSPTQDLYDNPHYYYGFLNGAGATNKPGVGAGAAAAQAAGAAVAAPPANPVGLPVEQPLMLGGRRQQAKRRSRPLRVPQPRPEEMMGEVAEGEAAPAPRPPQDPPQEGTGSSNSADSSDGEEEEQVQQQACSKRKREDSSDSGDRGGGGPSSRWPYSGWRPKSKRY